MSRICRGTMLVLLCVTSCHTPAGTGMVQRAVTLSGVVTYESGAPAVGAIVSTVEIKSGKNVGIVPTDKTGRFSEVLEAGRYAVTVSAPDSYAWIESQNVPNSDVQVVLKKSCNQLLGQVKGNASSSHMEVERLSSATGDTFIGALDRIGSFQLCLPDGQYEARLAGRALSRTVKVDLTGPSSLQLESFAAGSVRQPPQSKAEVHAGIDALLEDIIANKAMIIGLGEATHGTAEFYTSRGDLTFELIRRTGVRLLLFEFDAIASVELDRYVNGDEVDVAKAVADLGFWTTDTYEFRRFLEQLRQYNRATATDKVHIWGIDVQNTTFPVNVLMANANELGIAQEEQALVSRMGKRGKGVVSLSPTERSNLEALLARIATPRGPGTHHLLNAVAARSLRIQINYWTGDISTWARKRRESGMAELAAFLAQQMGKDRAVLWAHDAHITKEPDKRVLGYHLAEAKGGYYAVGFYLYEGSARAWDHESKIGVIPHPIPIAPSYTVEAAIMSAAAMPETAWMPLRPLPPALASWLATPRYVREIYATFDGDDAALTLRDVPAAFDALVVLHTGHDSTPTPTGVRTVDKK
jgi:erythromycin esterase